MNDESYKTRVLIVTDHQRITGDIALLPGARLTDYMCEAKLFIALTDVEVADPAGRPLLRAGFLNVHRDHVRFIAPAATVTAAKDASHAGN